jgi:hypothetical protein
MKKGQIFILIAVLGLMIFSTGYYFYAFRKSSLESNNYNQLKAVADLREKQITDSMILEMKQILDSQNPK